MQAVFAVITTVVKYVRTVLHQTGHFARPNSSKLRCRYVRYSSMCTIQIYHLYGQDIAKTFYQEKEPMSWHTPRNIFGRFDLFLYKYSLSCVRTVRYRTIATALPTLPTLVLVAYQRYQTSPTVVLVSLRTLDAGAKPTAKTYRLDLTTLHRSL
jgi:hypothetical protein